MTVAQRDVNRAKATIFGNQIWSSETKMLCMPSPPPAGNNSLAIVRNFFQTMLQQVCHFKVDVTARDANAAAYKYNKKQEYQDLHNSSIAITLREMQREVNAGHPFERKLHIEYSSNNRPTQLHAANDIHCCFMEILPW